MLVTAVGLLLVQLSSASQGYLHLDIARRNPDVSSIVRRQTSQATLTEAEEGSLYLVNLTIGTPGQKIAVQLDTGSSDLWIPSSSERACTRGECADGSYDSSRSSSYTLLQENGFNITYGDGSGDVGDWVQEVLSVGGGPTINNTILAVVTSTSNNQDPGTGVMGIGYDTNEAINTLTQDGIYETVVDKMVSQGLIARAAYSLYLNDVDAGTGSILFGGVDSTKHTGDLIALPLQLAPEGASADPNTPNAFYVTLSEVAFVDETGKSTTLSPDGYAQSALLDSGTSLTYLNNDILTSIANGLGATLVEGQEFVVPCAYANSNASIRYTFGGTGGPVVDVPLSQLVFDEVLAPTSQYSAASGGCVLGIGPEQDSQIILGDTFLRNAYVVYDQPNYQVAMAQAALDKASTSSIATMGTGTSIPGVSSTASATGTQLAYANEQTALSGVATPTGSSVAAGTPTFSLGAEATASTAQATATGAANGVGGSASGSGSSSSSGLATIPTQAPQAAFLGIAAAGLLLL